jgi:flagellar biosynthetic protein FlhB
LIYFNKKESSHKAHQGTKNGALLPNHVSQLIFSDKKIEEGTWFTNQLRPFVPLCLRERNFEGFYHAAQSMHLQWFAAEDEGRTHDPTEATYRRAREEGRVAKSQELISALGLLLPALAIIFLAPWMFRTCAEMLRFFFTRINELDPLTDRFTARIFARYFATLALPVLSVGFATALFSNIIQVGLHFSTKPLEFDLSKVLPKFGRYFQRTLFSVEGLVNLLKSIVKMLVIGAVAFFIIRSKFRELANLQTA